MTAHNPAHIAVLDQSLAFATAQLDEVVGLYAAAAEAGGDVDAMVLLARVILRSPPTSVQSLLIAAVRRLANPDP